MDYPPMWEADVVLADGGTMHVRPITPEDGPLISAFHARQSPESIYYRYFSPRPHLSDSDLEHLTNVDYSDRMAFVGLLGDDLIGVARYDRYPTSGKAEVAFFTDDAHRGRGMATVLLEYLAAAARDAGLTGFVAEVLPQNRKMLSVFKQAGFEVHSHFADGVIEVELGIEPTEEARAIIEERSRNAFAQSVRRLVAPRSIAVVGASRREEAIGHQMLWRLIEGGFQGPVYPINPNVRSVSSVRTHDSVLDVADAIDLAIICLPADQVRDVVSECARKHVQGLVIVSAGFSEAGELGTKLEHEIVEFAHRHGMRVIGPNSLGVVNTAEDVSMFGTFVGVPALAGNIGVVSQSGTLGAAIIGHARRIGLGISTFVSLGNKADVSSNDLLQYWEDDDDTALALLHLESFGNPHNFTRITRRLTRNKPVVAVKSRKSVRLAEDPDGVPLDASLDALLAQTGIIRVDTLEQLFDVAMVLSHQPIPSGNRLAIVSSSWGPAMLAADAAIGAGLVLADVSTTRFPMNPIDLGYAAGPDEFAEAIRAVAAAPGVDAMLVLCTPPVESALPTLAEAIARAANATTIPVVATSLGLSPMMGSDDLRTVPVFEFPEGAVHALGRVARYGAWLAREQGTMPELDLIDRVALRSIIDRILALPDPYSWLALSDAAEIAEATGLQMVRRAVVDGADDAIAAAAKIGWPVAMKATGLTRPAKTEAGGIAVDVHDPEELRRAHERMCELLGDAMHPAVVQQMAPPGVDVRIGMHRHPEVGAVVTMTVDNAFQATVTGEPLQVMPFSDADAHRLVEASGVEAPLRRAGFEITSAFDAVVDLLLKLSVLGDVVPEVASVILDPVLVSDEGAWVTDVRVRFAPSPNRPPPDVRRMVRADDL